MVVLVLNQEYRPVSNGRQEMKFLKLSLKFLGISICKPQYTNFITIIMIMVIIIIAIIVIN